MWGQTVADHTVCPSVYCFSDSVKKSCLSPVQLFCITPQNQALMSLGKLAQRFKLVVLIPLLILTQCMRPNQSECTNLDDVDSAQQDIGALRIVNEDSEAIRKIILQSPEVQEAWQQKTTFVSPESDWGGWVTILKADSNSNIDPSIENPIRLSTGSDVHAFFLVRNAWKKPHDLRIIFLLNLHQVPIIRSDGIHDFYDLSTLEPQEDRAFEFILPALSGGFHQLSILLVTDPDSLSTDGTYRLLQQKSFFEARYDLWVGTGTLPEEVVTFESAELGQAAGSRMGGVELVVSPDDKENKPLTSLALKPGEEHCLNLRLYNAKSEVNAPYTGPVPLRIAVFWNDKMEQVLDYDLLADAPDNLTLQLKVQTPSEAGSYQLSVVVFTFPGYSQFEAVGERTGYPWGAFSRRSLVEVQP